MRLRFISIASVSALIFSFSLFAQAPAAPAAAGAPQAGARGAGGAAGGRGAQGPAAPANVALENTRNSARHQSFLDVAKAGNINLLFVGDSITDWFYWQRGGNYDLTGKAVWDKTFAPLKAADFAIAGDTTQGALWRMQNGELDGFKAKLIILMLGTNNINRNPNDEIVDGDRLIIEEFKKRQPQAKVLLLGIFPRNMNPADPLRATIKEINSKLEKLADNKQVYYMDIGNKFLTADGTLTTEIMADGLHPTPKGYQIWADAIIDRVNALMK
jgi:lysophospholipase L1-like esterase